MWNWYASAWGWLEEVDRHHNMECNTCLVQGCSAQWWSWDVVIEGCGQGSVQLMNLAKSARSHLVRKRILNVLPFFSFYGRSITTTNPKSLQYSQILLQPAGVLFSVNTQFLKVNYWCRLAALQIFCLYGLGLLFADHFLQRLYVQHTKPQSIQITQTYTH